VIALLGPGAPSNGTPRPRARGGESAATARIERVRARVEARRASILKRQLPAETANPSDFMLQPADTANLRHLMRYLPSDGNLSHLMP
jgi:hypothetical protein